jgi:hypothetical protein
MCDRDQARGAHVPTRRAADPANGGMNGGLMKVRVDAGFTVGIAGVMRSHKASASGTITVGSARDCLMAFVYRQVDASSGWLAPIEDVAGRQFTTADARVKPKRLYRGPERGGTSSLSDLTRRGIGR